MKIYRLLKLNAMIKNHRVKFLGLYILHKLGKRYLAVNFDPVNACNLRCKMCYFTDKDYVKRLKGIFKPEDISLFSKAILSRALKLQVGCGTEPTLYKQLDQVFLEAKKYKVPHISLTTNANLLEEPKVRLWAECGLKEIIVSLHGVHKGTYEEFMGKGVYEKFHNALRIITEVKKDFPELSLRINYTFNEDNFADLRDFFEVYEDYGIDTIQLRPIKSLGNTAYQNFSMEKILPVYEDFIESFSEACKKRKVSLVAARGKNSLIEKKPIESVIFKYTYCYISPTFFWREDFDWRNESFEDYSSRTGWHRELLNNAFLSENEIKKLKTENLNYSVDLN